MRKVELSLQERRRGRKKHSLTVRKVSVPQKGKRALKKVPVFGKTNKKAASYCTSEQFSDGQILSLFCLTQWLRYLYDDLQRVI